MKTKAKLHLVSKWLRLHGFGGGGESLQEQEEKKEEEGRGEEDQVMELILE